MRVPRGVGGLFKPFLYRKMKKLLSFRKNIVFATMPLSENIVAEESFFFRQGDTGFSACTVSLLKKILVLVLTSKGL